MEPAQRDFARRRVAFSLQDYWIDEDSSFVRISPPLASSLDSSALNKPSIFNRISSSLAASPPAQLFSKLRGKSTETPAAAAAAASPAFVPLPGKSAGDASAAAADILAAISVLESDAVQASERLQQLVSHLNDHTQRCTILALPHAGVIKEAAAASSFYCLQSSQAILDFIASSYTLFCSYEELLASARPLKETAETVKTIKQALNRFEVYADQVLAVPESEP